MIEIAVVGSLNLDTTVRVPRLPDPGETVLGTGHLTDTGGKGANQAVAAARLGRKTAMVGMVGRDDAGDRLVRALGEAGVATGSVLHRAEHATGMALITVDDAARNTIVVSPGANGALAPGDLDLDLVAAAVVVLLQLEIPLGTVAAAARAATGTVVLNPAPGRVLDPDLLGLVDVLVPNETELGIVAGASLPESVEAADRAALSIEGPGAVVVTLGADGALVAANGATEHIPAPRVQAVDPTGAGDSFCAGLADALVRGKDLTTAVQWAVFCGAVTVTRRGAQASLPTSDEVVAAGGAR